MTGNRKNSSLALSIVAIAVGMLGLAYASVPLYNLFCRVTGFGGTTQVAESAPASTLDRVITVRFNADTAPNMPWEFKPDQKEVAVNVGEERIISYSATNFSDHNITGTSIYNVTPDKAGIYFNKIECFCFTEQILESGRKATFPVSFFIDPEIVNDKNLDDVNTITLSYTFFKAKE